MRLWYNVCDENEKNPERMKKCEETSPSLQLLLDLIDSTAGRSGRAWR
jgi:hypothetical protein